MWALPFYQTWLRAAGESAALTLDSQSVATLRVLGLAGLRPSDAEEALCMVLEKPAAFLAAGWAWQRAFLSGQDLPSQTLAAAQPLARKAAANNRRLKHRL